MIPFGTKSVTLHVSMLIDLLSIVRGCCVPPKKRYITPSLYYRKRGSASYIVREVYSVRERERERERYREREKDGSDVTIAALKLAMSFALLLAKNVHLSIGEEFCAFPCQKICTSVSPLLNGAEFTLSVAKNALFETVPILRTVKRRD